MAVDYPFLCAGQWRNGLLTEPSTNPYTGEIVASASQASAEDVDDATAAAVEAFKVTRKQSAFERSSILMRVAEGLGREREQLARLMVSDIGKPIRFCRSEVDRSVQTFTWAAEESKRFGGEYMPLDAIAQSVGYHSITRRFPLGPIAGVCPFNFPINLAAHKFAPAIATGNTIVLKPPPQGPLCTLELARIVEEAGVEPGSVSVLPCAVDVAGGLVADERYKLLSFTGSPEVGFALKSEAGKKHVVLELGGNAGAIVHDDADIEWAAKRLALGAFANAGQVCISVQRIYVHRPIFERFTAMFLEQTGLLKTGDPEDDETVVGPLIDDSAAFRIKEWIKEAEAGGAKTLAGGEWIGPRTLTPTVFTDADPDLKIVCEEVFGPVVILDSYDIFSDAIDAVNDSRYGLQAGVFTKNIDNIWQAFNHLDMGAVIVNDYPTFKMDQMPYGGVKDSGRGKEGVRYAMDSMTEERLVVFRTSDAG